MSEEIKWFTGLDWAREQHRICLVDGAGKPVAERDVTHDGTALAELCTWLLHRTGAQAAEIAVAIETPRGPMVEALLERGFTVFAINPKQLDRFRDRFSMAGAKDDSRDARVLACSLRTDRHAFRPVAADDPLIIELREWSRMHEELATERTRLANRVREQLWRYYPQAGELTNDVADDWFLDLWHRVPTPAQAARASEKVVGRILKSHRIRRLDAPAALAVLRRPPLKVAPGATEAAVAHIRQLAARLRLINQQIKQADHRLDELCGAIERSAEIAPGQICEQRDVAILRSCPGLGRINIATLLAEACQPVHQRDYHLLRTLTGSAPVTRRSGRSCVVVRRQACNNRLRNAVHHWARVAIQYDPISRQRYDALRRRGHGHARALRSVGDRLLFVLCILLQRQVLFDPGHRSQQLAAA
jgi:transposase